MKTLIIPILIGWITWWTVWYIYSNVPYPSLSSIMNVKTLNWKAEYQFLISNFKRDIEKKSYCIWDCRDYSSSSSSRWSYWWWGK